MASIEYVMRLYNKQNLSDWFGVYDYTPMLNSFGRILVEIHDGDYQGDSYLMFVEHREGDPEYGILVFGWGSCSGCDALQACDAWSEVTDLYNELEAQIQWRTESEMRDYVMSHDWGGDWFIHNESGQVFVKTLQNYFGIESD